ncbi:MAG: phosphatidylglycerol lysyltransferase domain-containing protein [Rhodobacteraceae bacterium]|nr:phosphatidylglycerol lysyltransferase domain-containing protein [Paracoccaceae bacterium]
MGDGIPIGRTAGPAAPAGPGGADRKAILRAGWPVLVAPCVLWAAGAPALQGGLAGSLPAVPVLHWAVAALLALAGLRAAARLDLAVGQWRGAALPGAGDAAAGRAAVAIGAASGFGPLVGALVRWRFARDRGFGPALAQSLAFAAAFGAGLAVHALVALTLFGRVPAPAAAALALAGAAGLAAAPAGLRRLAARTVWLTGIDLLCAGLCLWLFLPAGTGVAASLGAMALALPAGLVAATPAGAGALDAVLGLALPGVAPGALAAALAAWRISYVLLPALPALAALLRHREARAGAAGGAATVVCGAWLEEIAPRYAASAPRAEGLILRQAGMACALHEGAVWPCARAAAPGGWPAALVLLADPAPGAGQRDAMPLIGAIGAAAGGLGRIPVLYKCGPRVAAAARRAGWQVLPVARDAVVDPRTFDLSVPARAGLRRKLRRAGRAGVSVEACGAAALPLAEMAALSRDWAARRGGERGLSGGRVAPHYVAGQKVLLARAGGRLVGFATFHAGARERALDLLRTAADAPDGTVHALIAAAIAEAGAAGCARLSLAAVPCAPEALRHPLPRLLARLALAVTGPGLGRLKAGFAPRWETRYAAAPGRAALLGGGAAILAAILRPPPLPPGGAARPGEGDAGLPAAAGDGGGELPLAA